jgi:digeranylgeranylglycerophospholipid reductase
MIQTAIVGGGVAGAYCAYQLAENGLHPVIFDHSHPREKPCGGLVSPLALKLFPFLKRLPIDHSERDRLYVISPSGKKECVRFRKSKMLGFSRLELDQYLVKMAIDRGTKLIKERVTSIERKNHLWNVKTQKQTYLAKTLIGADGVNSIVREKIIGPLDAKNKGLCFGYLVRGLEREEITLRLSPYRNGYIWVIPRSKNTSLGIGCSEIKFSYGLKKELDVFIQDNFPQVEIISKWAALVPNVKSSKIFRVPLAGINWILIGDAAGHVSPISGEGILYALLDGELAAQAVAEKKPQIFDRLWKESYGWSFFLDIILGNWVYQKSIREFYCEGLKLESLIQLIMF